MKQIKIISKGHGFTSRGESIKSMRKDKTTVLAKGLSPNPWRRHSATQKMFHAAAFLIILIITVTANAGASPINGGAIQGMPRTGDSVQFITVGGLKRPYRLHLPPIYDGSTPLPLVLVLHGKGGNGMGMEQLTQMGVKADAENFIAVFPNATGDADAWNSGFNPANTSTVDDVVFLRALLDKLQNELRVDNKRIYCCGFSSGALMTGRAGAELTDRFAAIGIVAGSVGSKQPNGSTIVLPNLPHSLPVIIFHGKRDQRIYYNGGGPAGVDFLSVADSVAFWMKQDGCRSSPHEETAQNGNLIKVDYNPCKGGSEVVLYTFLNGTHEWPRPDNNDHFSATDAIWAFFARHPKQ